MYSEANILSVATKQAPITGSMELVYEKAQQIPGSVQYNIERYRKEPNWFVEDTAMLVYNYQASDSDKSNLTLKFCLSGNVYCKQHQKDCNQCQLSASSRCVERVESIDLVNFNFSPLQLSQLVKPGRSKSNLTDSILRFEHTSSFARTIPLCGKTLSVLEGILNHNYTDDLENIYINAQTQILLLYSLDCMLGEKEIDMAKCKFLANEQDREKITLAREILVKHIGTPITIKELSRKVAINECYLKKGFREMFGTTIFDFYQSQRMEHAKYLLYEKGLTVTDVSMLLGYSSISHFSTAFKNHTGLKPCELLFR
jgi:AraC-like DNA-binding protein